MAELCEMGVTPSLANWKSIGLKTVFSIHVIFRFSELLLNRKKDFLVTFVLTHLRQILSLDVDFQLIGYKHVFFYYKRA